MFIGNGKYCYANSTSMLLKSIGEHVSPEKIEVLTGMGLGATIYGDLLFLDSTFPDLGISKALDILGFTFQECTGESSERAPFQAIKDILKESAVILGPVDLGFFTFWPNHQYLHGADHYVLAYDIDDQNIYFHDPAGYPYVSLPLEQFEKAWRADHIEYRREPFRYWHSAKRYSQPSEEDIYEKALNHFKRQYQDREKVPYITGSHAILQFSEGLKNGEIPNRIAEHCTHFLFQLGAKRANDFAEFFKERHPGLSNLKVDQAKLLGHCHVLSASRRWKELSELLKELSALEHAFHNELLSI